MALKEPSIDGVRRGKEAGRREEGRRRKMEKREKRKKLRKKNESENKYGFVTFEFFTNSDIALVSLWVAAKEDQ